MDDPATLEKAFQDAEAVFAVTNYWDTMSKEKEVQQGKNMADAAKVRGNGQTTWTNHPDFIYKSEQEKTKKEGKKQRNPWVS